MKLKLFIVGGLCLAIGYFTSLSTSAQSKSAPPKIESTIDKASYGIGFNMGKNFKQQGINLNLRLYVTGLQDALRSREQAVSDEEIAKATTALEAKILEGKMNRAQAFMDKNKERKGVQVTPRGLQYRVLKKGNGPSPKLTDTFVAHYHGRLIDGSVFDSSLKGKPLTLGVSQVIEGWKDALQMMKVGDKWQLYVPPNLAYGLEGSPPNIGPYEVLVFDIELLDVKTGQQKAPAGQ